MFQCFARRLAAFLTVLELLFSLSAALHSVNPPPGTEGPVQTFVLFAVFLIVPTWGLFMGLSWVLGGFRIDRSRY